MTWAGLYEIRPFICHDWYYLYFVWKHGPATERTASLEERWASTPENLFPLMGQSSSLDPKSRTKLFSDLQKKLMATVSQV